MKTLDLYITRICNLNCEYCYVDLESRENGFKYEKFVERVNLLDYDCIKFFGGEPLVKWKEIVQIIDALHGKNKKFCIVTNGLLLTKEKLQFCLENAIEVVISLHFKSIKQLLPKIPDYIFAKNILWFSLIFEDIRLSYPYTLVAYLEKIGFQNFILTPEVYGDWNDENLEKLQKELSKCLQLFQKNPKIKFTGPSANELLQLRKWCTKNIYTKEWDRSPCNRFKTLKTVQKNFVIDVYEKMNSVIDYDNLPNKWFYVCPIGWYLDTISLEKSFETRLVEYKKLNEIFVDFYKKIDAFKWRMSFLSERIDEIRFNLTLQCNIRCEYCYVDFQNKKLDFLTAKNIIDFLVLQKGDEKIISFFGGEPLLEFELLKKITLYAKEKFHEKNKKISFKIATNFLLINEEKLDFFNENNFEIHISLNGENETNDKMRDNSTKKLLQKFSTFSEKIDKNRVVILLAFSNREIENLTKNIAFIVSLGFFRVNFEMIFWKKYFWNRSDFLRLSSQFLQIKKADFFKNLSLNTSEEPTYILDISTDGTCHDNSLEFNDYDADFSKQKICKKLMWKLLADKNENTL